MLVDGFDARVVQARECGSLCFGVRKIKTELFMGSTATSSAACTISMVRFQLGSPKIAPLLP